MFIKIVIIGLVIFMIYNLFSALFIMNKPDPNQTQDVYLYWTKSTDLSDHCIDPHYWSSNWCNRT